VRFPHPSRLTAAIRTVLARPHLLAAPIVLTGLVAVSLLAFGGSRSEAKGEAVVPGPGDAARWPSSSSSPTVTSPTEPAAETAPAAPVVSDLAAARPAPPPVGGPSSDPVVNRPPPRPNRSSPSPAPGNRPPSPGAGSVAVHPNDFPDPFVLQAKGVYWAFSTESRGAKIPAMRSVDLRNWTPVGDSLASLPRWASPGHVWAPSVLERGAAFVMYYTTRHTATGLQCISRAVSLLPQGPYLDHSGAPLICQTERGGSIDPSPFIAADGRPWLTWKSEGTLRGEPTRIWVQELTSDGQGLTGNPTQLLVQQLDWEFPIVKGPSMALIEGRYHLFYSANRWETADYAVGHAICASPIGPCRRTSPTPALAAGPTQAGPGGQGVVTAPTGELVLVHHAWEPGRVGYPHGARRLHLSGLRVEGDRVQVLGPWGRAPALGG
jgi:hypothetical protein